MPITTPQEIVAIECPGKETDSRLDDFIDLAELQLDPDVFLDKYNLALALLVCHWFALEAMGGGDENGAGSGVSGGIKSEKEGDLARSFGTAIPTSGNQSDIYYNQTIHGQKLYQLIRSCVMMARNKCI